MTAVTANDAVSVFLTPLKEATEIRDASGKLLGCFTPASAEDLLYERDVAQFDPKELSRRAASNERGYTTEEVLGQLRSAEGSG